MRIAVRAFDGITTFTSPRHCSCSVSCLAGTGPGWSFRWSDDGHPVRTDEGVTMGDLRDRSAAEHADLLVFPSWPIHLPEPDPKQPL